jgi:hypothetical protein
MDRMLLSRGWFGCVVWVGCLEFEVDSKVGTGRDEVSRVLADSSRLKNPVSYLFLCNPQQTH